MSLDSIDSTNDPLPSWTPGNSKNAIIEFVSAVSNPEGRDYVDPSRRIATFDNDGTLWAEQPYYIQLQYAVDTLRELISDRPDLKKESLLDAAANGQIETVLAAGKEGLMKIIAATHAGMTVEEFQASTDSWIKSARHPRFGRKYREMVYQPMLELLAFLRRNAFDIYIVSAGGIEFMRVFAEQIYGIPPQNVIGSSLKTAYDVRDGAPVLTKLPELDFHNEYEGKPIAINHHIGKRPILAAGNSDGDFDMLEYTTAGPGKRLGLLIHHTDSEREWAYDRDSRIGRLNKGLDEAAKRGWILADMERDWHSIFPFEMAAHTP